MNSAPSRNGRQGPDALAEPYFEDSRRYIERYSQVIGAYRFAGFSVVASPLPTGFGMPTLTYIGAQVLKLPFIRATSLGHEVLHNWWGNGVYPDHASGNWSEGLTTLMADYLYRAQESEAAAREMRLGWLRDFASVPSVSHRPLSTFRSRAHGADAAVGYGKAAMVFVMLRDLIGEDAFARGIRSFWNRHRFTVASWDDLRRAFEESSGRPLRTFFTQWLERSGAPQPAIVTASADTTQVRHRPRFRPGLDRRRQQPGRACCRDLDARRVARSGPLDSGYSADSLIMVRPSGRESVSLRGTIRAKAISLRAT
jgi:hypothetical protein